MIQWLYSIVVRLVDQFIWLPGLVNDKVKKGNIGRQKTFDLLASAINNDDRVIWMHVASLGEFEQGRPVIEALKKIYPDYKILLSFFSPSGYELRKNYEYADVICYLPLDTKSNASQFIQLAHPSLCIFVKYELWPNYLKVIRDNGIDALLISTVINIENGLFIWTKKWLSKMLNSFNYILTQDYGSLELIESLNYKGRLQVAGDTRIDRTISIAQGIKEILPIKMFCGDHDVFIAGSTWAEDEKLIAQLVDTGRLDNWRIIIAPHDVSENRISSIVQLIGGVRLSQLNAIKPNEKVLIIDNIGLLNQIYQYGKLVYIGGGFGTGIHNVLEPAAFGLPITFGPKYRKFIEARALVSNGGAKNVNNARELVEYFDQMLNDAKYGLARNSVQGFMENNQGATEKVMQVISSYLTD